MNWGKSIVLVFVVFAGFIGSLVFLMTRQRVDLVRDDYYQTEMAYQLQIERAARTARLGSSFDLTYDADHQQIAFAFPDSVQSGKVSLYRPSDRRQDTFVSLNPKQERQTISTAKLAKGYWKIQFSWSDGRQDYFTEKPLYIK
ncbi:FixH family protein [Larkinella harenae]